MIIERIVIAVMMILIVSFIAWCIYSVINDMKRNSEIIEEIDKCNKYLDSCFNRACLSTSTEGLELLWQEMSLIKDTYTLHNNSFIRFREIRAFIKGKYRGLLRSEELLNSPN